MSHTYPSNNTALAADARNRALRTALVGFALDAATAVVLAVYEWVNTSGNDVDWRLLPALLLKTVLASAGSYLLRRNIDPSAHLNAILPPSEPGEPAAHTPPKG